MNIIRQLLLYIEANSSLIIGEDLFQGVFHIGTNTGILLYSFGGDQNETNLRAVNVQIAVHANDYDSADTSIQSIWDMLTYSKGITLDNGEYIFNIVPIKYPGFVTTTEQDKFVFTCSLVAYYEGD